MGTEVNEILLKKIKIEEVIGSYIDLKLKGSNFWACCPFHIEKSPSFSVSPLKQIYKCFGCGKSGDAITFVSELKSVSQEGAILEILSKLDIELAYDFDNNTITFFDFDENSINNKVLKPILSNFNSNIDLVKELMNFDKILIDFCITHIEDLDHKIRSSEEIKITNVMYYPGNTLQQLRQIKSNNSLKSKYESIFNQCLVLLISYFTSVLKDIFIASLQYFAGNKKGNLGSINSEIKLSFEELESYNFNLADSIGDLIVRKKNISFQDMQSTCREFQSYFGVNIPKNKIIDNIIVAQAARHTIVHSLSLADEKFMNQISGANLRSIKKEISLNEDIKFSPAEIEEVIKNIKEFLNDLAQQLIVKTK